MNAARPLLILLFASTSLHLFGQMPNTNIILLDLKMNEVKTLVDNPTLLSGFNVKGYNNQPHFIDNSNLLITSDWQANGMTDIYQLNLNERSILRITNTEESEYSPTPINSNQAFSFVKQETIEDQVSQTLWQFPLNRENGGASIISEIKNIGYHSWLDDTRVALFLVGENDAPHKLVIYDTQSKEERFVAYNVGRCFRFINDDELLFVQMIGTSWAFRSFSLSEGRSKAMFRTLDKSEDFVLTKNGYVIAAQGSELFSRKLSENSQWTSIKKLDGYGVNKITRIAASDNKVAIVVSE